MHRIGGLRSVAWPALALVFSTAALAQSANPFVPAEFDVPAKLETKEFRLRMLTVNDVVKDYDAVMTSIAHLKTVWPGGTWPEGLTFEQDLIDLGWHQIVSPDGKGETPQSVFCARSSSGPTRQGASEQLKHGLCEAGAAPRAWSRPT